MFVCSLWVGMNVWMCVSACICLDCVAYVFVYFRSLHGYIHDHCLHLKGQFPPKAKGTVPPQKQKHIVFFLFVRLFFILNGIWVSKRCFPSLRYNGTSGKSACIAQIAKNYIRKIYCSNSLNVPATQDYPQTLLSAILWELPLKTVWTHQRTSTSTHGPTAWNCAQSKQSWCS